MSCHVMLWEACNIPSVLTPRALTPNTLQMAAATTPDVSYHFTGKVHWQIALCSLSLQ
jgi:hypothetical protein